MLSSANPLDAVASPPRVPVYSNEMRPDAWIRVEWNPPENMVPALSRFGALLLQPQLPAENVEVEPLARRDVGLEVLHFLE